MGSQVFSPGSGNLGGFSHGDQGRHNRGGGGNRQSHIGGSSGDRQVGGGNSESVDIIGHIVDSLKDTVGVNKLVAATGHTQSILRFNPGRVDVLVAKAVLAKLILGVKLARGHRGDDSRGNGSNSSSQRLGSNGGGSNKRLRGDGQGGRVNDLNGSRDNGGGSSLHQGSRSSMQKGGGTSTDKGSRGSMNQRSRGSMYQRSWSSMHQRSRSGMHKRQGSSLNNRSCMHKDGGSRDLVVPIDRFSFPLLPLDHSNNSRLGSIVGSQVFSTGSSNFGGFSHGDQGCHNRGSGGKRQSNISGSRGYRQVGGGDSESVDIIGHIVDSLKDTVGVNKLVAATGHTQSILRFNPGRVDVLVAKAVLAKLILGVELAGGHRGDDSRGNGSKCRSSQGLGHKGRGSGHRGRHSHRGCDSVNQGGGSRLHRGGSIEQSEGKGLKGGGGVDHRCNRGSMNKRSRMYKRSSMEGEGSSLN